jgi:hypothetical protein
VKTVVAKEQNLLAFCSLSHLRRRGGGVAQFRSLLEYSEAGGKSCFLSGTRGKNNLKLVLIPSPNS